MTYAIAPIINGVAFPEKDWAVDACPNISATPITMPNAVFFVIAIVLFVIGASVIRTA